MKKSGCGRFIPTAGFLIVLLPLCVFCRRRCDDDVPGHAFDRYGPGAALPCRRRYVLTVHYDRWRLDCVVILRRQDRCHPVALVYGCSGE